MPVRILCGAGMRGVACIPSGTCCNTPARVPGPMLQVFRAVGALVHATSPMLPPWFLLSRGLHAACIFGLWQRRSAGVDLVCCGTLAKHVPEPFGEFATLWPRCVLSVGSELLCQQHPAPPAHPLVPREEIATWRPSNLPPATAVACYRSLTCQEPWFVLLQGCWPAFTAP